MSRERLDAADAALIEAGIAEATKFVGPDGSPHHFYYLTPLEAFDLFLTYVSDPIPKRPHTAGVVYENYSIRPTDYPGGVKDFYDAQEQKGREPRFRLGMTRAFLQSIAKCDRGLQGKAHLAIADLSIEPCETRGDTVKPLQGSAKGLWRYRIGAYRLIYRPEKAAGFVTLLALLPRATAYDALPRA